MDGLTAGQERFADLVATRTGLELRTVRAWVAAENGPDDNPLNIMAAYPRIARYRTPEAAAGATIRNLRTPRYAHVLRTAARTKDPHEELTAIAVSPWEENNYRGRTTTPGTLLEGAFARLYGRDGNDDSFDLPIPGVPGVRIPVPDGLPFVDVPNPADWIRDLSGWVERKAPVAALYVVLSSAAVALIVLGLLRTAGTGPLELLGAARGGIATRRQRRASEEIPY